MPVPPNKIAPPAPTQADRADRHALYQNAVQRPRTEVDFLERTFERLRGRRPKLLREDFCGPAGVACEWARRRPGNLAFGVDLDPEVLKWARENNLDRLPPGARRRVRLLSCDVLDVSTRPVDIVIALNFSYWVFKDRALMRRYFERVRAGLVEDGMLFIDAFGGYEAYSLLCERTPHRRFVYVWNQKAYDPISGEYLCSIDFEFPDGSRLRDAFTYDWRLWTLPELRELLVEAGFALPMVYWEGWSEKLNARTGRFNRIERGEPNAGWVCYLVAPR